MFMCPFTLGKWEKLPLILILFLGFESLRKGEEKLGNYKRKLRRESFRGSQKKKL
jgi:hypothetical protein